MKGYKSEAIKLMVGKNVLPFGCCSYCCLFKYVSELCEHEEVQEL